MTGHYVPLPSAAGEKARAFVPNPLPPDPPLVLDAELQELVEKAMLALGRLDGLTTVLPDPTLFLYSYVRKEAVLSSQIEGTQSSLSDLLLFEHEGVVGVPLDDVQELRLRRRHELRIDAAGKTSVVAPIVEGNSRRSAVQGAQQQERAGRIPSLAKLGGRLAARQRRFRAAAARPVARLPRRAGKVPAQRPGKTPLLVKAALAHVQFDTIHPFLDGNGRLAAG